MAEVNIGRDTAGSITVTFPYSTSRVAKVKTIAGRKWDPEKKYWVFPDSNGTLQKIIQVFDSEEVNLDPALDLKLPYLLQQVHKAVQAHHYSVRTEQTYVNWIKRFILFHGKKDPSKMGEKEINEFLTHLKVLKFLDGDKWLMVMLLYGAGLRLMECLRLRVKDVAFSTNQIIVRDGKGSKDRLTMLPDAVKKPLTEHLYRVRELHQHDLKDGYGRVYMPYALDRKYPNAASEWGWQHIFPAPNRFVNP